MKRTSSAKAGGRAKKAAKKSSSQVLAASRAERAAGSSVGATEPANTEAAANAVSGKDENSQNAAATTETADKFPLVVRLNPGPAYASATKELMTSVQVNADMTIEDMGKAWNAMRKQKVTLSNVEFEHFGEKIDHDSGLCLSEFGILEGGTELDACPKKAYVSVFAAAPRKTASTSSSSKSGSSSGTSAPKSAKKAAVRMEPEATQASTSSAPKFSEAQLRSLPHWKKSELVALARLGRKSSDPNIREHFSFASSHLSVTELRNRLVEAQVASGVLLQDNPEACKLIGHVSAASTVNPVSSASPAALEAQEAARLAKAIKDRDSLDNVDFDITYSSLPKTKVLAAGLRVKSDYGSSPLKFMKEAFVAWQKKNGRKIDPGAIRRAGLSYRKPNLYPLPLWTMAEYKAVAKEKKIPIVGLPDMLIRSTMQDWCEDNHQMLTEADKPKKTSTKFSAVVIKDALKARNLVRAGKKGDLEARLFAWEGHNDLVTKKDRCFFCLSSFDGAEGSHCPSNCGAGLDFATCSNCVSKLCSCDKISNQRVASNRGAANFGGGRFYRQSGFRRDPFMEMMMGVMGMPRFGGGFGGGGCGNPNCTECGDGPGSDMGDY